jgi:RNA polymerase sigma-70 factor (ECF subfamily)
VTTTAQAKDANGAAISGDDLVRAFNDLRAELVNTLYFVLGNQDDAQDAAQDAFLKCWRSRETMTGIQNLRAWIFRVGLNAAKDLQRNAWRRRARPMTETTPEAASPEAAPDDAAQEKESLEHLRAAVKELRPDEQAVFLLRQNADLSYQEIAEIRKCPVGTVKTQMRAALQKLRIVLQVK